MTAVRKHVTGAKAETPQSAAQRMYDEVRGDEERAIERLANYADGLPSLRRSLLLIAARQLVGGVRRSDNARIVRGEVWRPNEAGARAAMHRAQAVGALVTKSLYDVRFKVDGTVYVLGDSTPEELQQVAAHYIGQGQTMVRTGRWLERVIASTPTGKRVRDAVGLKALKRMKAEAEQLPV